MEPLLIKHPQSSDLHYYSGYVYAHLGDIWRALPGYEWALDLSNDPAFWMPLASLYLDIEMKASALHAFRQALKHGVGIMPDDNIPLIIDVLENEVSLVAQNLNLPVAKVEQGLRLFEQAEQALHTDDYTAAVTRNKRAIKILGDWSPPHNNLSLALFYAGHPQDAIETTRRVLAIEDDNVQALSNIIRYLAWTGQRDAAHTYWQQLKDISPSAESLQLKKAEAAAVLDDDETVYNLLRHLETSDALPNQTFGEYLQVQLFIAVAEANTQRTAHAKRRLKKLKKEIPWAGEILAALQRGKTSIGYKSRFPYFHSTEIVTPITMENFLELIGQEEKLAEETFNRKMDAFIARFPQFVTVAEKLLWEENQPDVGIALLAYIATPAAYDALRRFATGQAGSDDLRMNAVMILSNAGQFSPTNPLRFWRNGTWEEIASRSYELTSEKDDTFTPQIQGLMERAYEANIAGDDQEAEKLFKQVLAIDPRTKEAYNNLGTIYGKRGNIPQAEAQLHKALEIDPLYVFPRCNLTLRRLGAGDIEGAEALLEPLAGRTRFHPQEMTFYVFTQAKLKVATREYDAARKFLEMALEIDPDYDMAHNLLDYLDDIATLGIAENSYWAKMRQRELKKRAKLQSKLTTAKPTLSDTLSLYTKEQLTAIARVAIFEGSWSSLRKAELKARILEELNNIENLQWIIDDLSADEHAILKTILANGGHLPWDDFDARYGNDMEESPYWIYHVPKTSMGRLRLRVLLAEAVVNDQLIMTIPTELRPLLIKILA